MRLALRRLAKAVVIISSRHEGARFAMAATAVSELSLDPPSLLICVNESASLHNPLTAGAHFCVNILDASQEHLARLASGAAKGEARFEQGDWIEASNGAPCLRDAQATFVCENRTSLAYGSHSIFIGEVVEACASSNADPLVYADQRYGKFAGFS
jgi:flavin reductase (DIM6/NTAB) family NADH-FMN oxidoreductase RutF